ncbi:aminotransferase class V-fold PLP-dependent enzyme [Anaerovorax odorimutans]|uniref:cysteine desulfurase n=1 Tax=Anaerovorax odorimutans TaxID=109327 RepID=A0ABT1RMM8_9FIRM|nr:aminotransferase class V-fold PLP-dependent enzyme [Anaerovorax odorimutans]MCQ4636439.1 aminotransferase class V-fold PLP-dependent enzyme [Anaerovorax odorimutans]
MKQIYFDNGSTSFPKAPGLGEAMGKHIDYNGYNISRGGYSKAYSLEGEIIEAREAVCRLFHCDDVKKVIFTPGATIGLNMVLKGLLKRGDHVITTSMEHNAVVRPLAQLEAKGVLWSRAQCDEKGRLDPQEIRKLIRPETKLVLAIHGSNVCGTLIPIEEIGRICRENRIFFCVDASQTAGSAVIDMQKCNADALIFPGHKALLGPQGIGGMILSRTMAETMEPLFSGGTGSASHREEMPELLPDKFQPGTLNIPGIIGLKHALAYIEKEGLVSMMEKKKRITDAFLEEVGNMKGVRLIGLPAGDDRCSVVSLDFVDQDNAEVAFRLENEFGIMTRCGLHCAPHAHKTLGTFPQGTVRFSFGCFNTITEIRFAAGALNRILCG